MPTTAMERINEKFPENKLQIEKFLRENGNDKKAERLMNLIAERGLYIGEMGHNLGAKAPKSDAL
jgi:hypothetical protein